MSIKLSHFSTPKTSRYAVLGQLTEKTKFIWVVLHGYGHLCNYFIRKFESFQAEQVLIIAPEGLHRFYLNGTDGKVGASWMTKEDRENDILDYINYLDLTLLQVCDSQKLENIRLIGLGFSQGGATLSRWLVNSKYKFSAFILWASVFPPDMEISQLPKNIPGYFIVGDQDEYINADRIKDFQQFVNDHNLNICIEIFQGNHSIPTPVISNFSSQLHTLLQTSK